MKALREAVKGRNCIFNSPLNFCNILQTNCLLFKGIVN